jgi:hypothetical protein
VTTTDKPEPFSAVKQCIEDFPTHGLGYLKERQEQARAEIKQAEGETATIRKELWLGHGHEGLYGDDGEMQCQGFDFKRDTIERCFEHYMRALREREAKWRELLAAAQNWRSDEPKKWDRLDAAIAAITEGKS